MGTFPIFPGLFRAVSLHPKLPHLQKPATLLHFGDSERLARWAGGDSAGQTCAPLTPEAFPSTLGAGVKRTGEEIGPKSRLPGPLTDLVSPPVQHSSRLPHSTNFQKPCDQRSPRGISCRAPAKAAATRRLPRWGQRPLPAPELPAAWGFRGLPSWSRAARSLER